MPWEERKKKQKERRRAYNITGSGQKSIIAQLIASWN
jgi:hypothetical protein